MLQNLSDFVDPEKERDATLFLPAAIFGYIYSEYSAVPACPWVSDNIGTLGAPESVFMVLAVLSAALAAGLYNNPDASLSAAQNEDSWGVAIAWMGQSGFVLLSVSELVIRICNQDTILVGILLLYVILFVSTVFGQEDDE